MTDDRRKGDRRIPPAVADFALQERQQLLATIARYETTAENYELLQAKVDEQAREIERLEAEIEDTLVDWGQVRLELAALKAQPSGVDERAAFEAAYAAELPCDVSVLVLLRDGPNSYKAKEDRLTMCWRMWQARASLTASAPNHSEQVREVASVQITGHLDEVDAPVWEFINAEARKLGTITGSIDSYGLSRPNGGHPNGGVVVLWNGPKIHAVALAVRDAMNRTMCVRLLAAAPSAAPPPGECVAVPRDVLADLVSLDREKRISAERHLYALLAQQGKAVGDE